MEIYLYAVLGLLLLAAAHFIQLNLPKTEPYVIREILVNGSEKMFYKMLSEKLPERYLLLAKVRLEDVIGVNTKMDKREVWRHRGYVKSRHVDFLICDRVTSKPLIGIELDGSSHFSKSTKSRDRRVNGIYKQAGLSLVHVRVGSNFDVEIEKILSGLTPSHPDKQSLERS